MKTKKKSNQVKEEKALTEAKLVKLYEEFKEKKKGEFDELETN